jgi:hypothetical protein
VFNSLPITLLTIERVWILYLQNLNIDLHSLAFSVKVLGERMERDSMVGCNDKIVIENKLNVGECRIFECRQSKSQLRLMLHFKSKRDTQFDLYRLCLNLYESRYDCKNGFYIIRISGPEYRNVILPVD